MKKVYAKYFWGFNEKALRGTENILKDPDHPRFNERMVTLLCRCDKPKEVFSLLPKNEFIRIWPQVNRYWKKIAAESDFRDWWQTIYEQSVKGYKKIKPKGAKPAVFSKIGAIVKQGRLNKGLSQGELALRVGMKQPDISNIEEGKKNITLRSLAALCRVLGIKNIEVE